MENLEEKVAIDAADTSASPSTEENQDSKSEPVETEEEKTDEQLKEEIARLDEEIKKEEDAKEKRHKEQDKGWKLKIIKEREKAKLLEEENIKKEETLKQLETRLFEEAYSKTIDDNFWLPYFESLSKSNPDLANKLAQEKWWKKNAQELIFETKKQLANEWDEELKKVVSEEEIRMSEREKVKHELALEEAESMFNDLDKADKAVAKEYFDDIVEGKRLTPITVKKYVEMAKFYALKDKKPDVDKEKVLASQASTWISSKSWNITESFGDVKAIRQQLINAGVPMHQVDLMYPLN